MVNVDCVLQSRDGIFQPQLYAHGLSFHPRSHCVERFSELVIELSLLRSDSFRQLKPRQLCAIFPLGDLQDEEDPHWRLCPTYQASQYQIPRAEMPELK